MSFCYARIEGDDIFIGVDMKFTTENIDMTKSYFGDVLAENMNKYGIIKNIIINDNICIAFAGNNILLADELLSKIDWNCKDIEKIIKEANDIHQNTNNKNDVEFIIAYANNSEMKLIQIKNGMTKDLKECYIGSDRTNEIMINTPVKREEVFIIEEKKSYSEELPLTYKLENRFRQTLKVTDDETVGENAVIIRFCKKENRFKYNEWYEADTGLKPKVVPIGEAICFDASAVDGGYTCSFYADERNALYKNFQQTHKSICYYHGYIKDGVYCYLYLPRFE